MVSSSRRRRCAPVCMTGWQRKRNPRVSPYKVADVRHSHIDMLHVGALSRAVCRRRETGPASWLWLGTVITVSNTTGSSCHSATWRRSCVTTTNITFINCGWSVACCWGYTFVLLPNFCITVPKTSGKVREAYCFVERASSTKIEPLHVKIRTLRCF